jgi:hypothetical protein
MADDLHDFMVVTLDDRNDERLLAGKILIQRTHADARLLGDVIRARLIETFPDQNASGCFDQGVDCRA